MITFARLTVFNPELSLTISRMLSPLKFFAFVALVIASHFATAQRIFWNEPNNDRIRFGTLSNTSLTTPVNLLSHPNIAKEITFDPGYNYAFFTDNSGASFYQSTYAGENPVEIEYFAPMAEALDIDYSVNAGGVYVVKFYEDGGIDFTLENGGGTNSVNMGTRSGNVYNCVAVDDGNERIFTYDVNSNLICAVNFSGGEPEDLISADIVTAMDYSESSGTLVYATETGDIAYYKSASDLDVIITVAEAGTITSIAYYAAYNKIYYVINEKIFSVNFDGSGTTQLMNLAGTGVTDLWVEPDQTLPTVTSRYPAVGQTGITAGSTFSLDFTEAIRVSSDAGLGTQIQIRLIETATGTPIATYDRSDAKILVTGSSVTISGLPFEDGSKEYHILIGNRVFEDMAGNNYVGITTATGWNFTSAVDNTKFYSIKSGTWNDPTIWSHDGHNGTPAGSAPGTGDVFIGAGHTVTMTANEFVWGDNNGLVIETGGALDMANFNLEVLGNEFRINGTLRNAGNISGSFDLYAVELPVFVQILPGVASSVGEEITLHTNVVSYVSPSTINGGAINTNGFEVCTPPTIPVSPVVTNINGSSINLAWTPGSGTAFILIRDEGNSSTKPKFEMTYTPNVNFGTGTDVGNSNFALYQGTANNVTVTGLSPATAYVVDMYGFNTSIGGCYSLNNYQTWNFVTCPTLAAPTNPVGATYCTGDTKPALVVDDPGIGRNIDWYDAATGGNLVTGNTSGGNARGEVFIPTATSGTFYAQLYDGVSGCASTTRTAVTLTMNPAITPGTASATQNLCTGGDPTVITGGTATGGTGTFTYQWMTSLTAGGPYNALMGATSATYDPPAGVTQSAYYVRTVISGVCSRDGSEIAVNVVSSPIITAQPAAEIVCAGEAASFNVVATGVLLTYQWQLDNGSGFTNVSNGGVYSGATATTLSISNTTGLNGVRYRCIVTSTATCSTPSGGALLTVNTRPSAVDVPVAVCEITSGSGGANINLLDYNDEVTGNDATASVVWYESDTYLTPLTNPNLVFASTGRTYYPRVSSTNTCTDDAVLTVTVKYKPEVTPLPTERLMCSGTQTNLSYESQPNGATYSWTVSSNGSISGASNGNGTTINHTLNNSASTQQRISYTVTPTLDGCTGAPFAQSVAVDPVPTIFNVTGGGGYCAGGTGVEIKLSGSQTGVKYTLMKDNVPTSMTSDGNNGAITFSNVTAAGSYTIRATTAATCNGNMNGAVVVAINAAPTGTAVIDGASLLCIGEEQPYNVKGIFNATSYTWTLPNGAEAVTPSTTASITIRAIGTIDGPIRVEPSNACGVGAPTTIGSLALTSRPETVVNIQTADEIYAGEATSFSYSTTAVDAIAVWNFGDGNGTGNGMIVEHTYEAEGNYTVTVVVSPQSGCAGSATADVTVKPKASLGTLAIKNVVTANGDQSNDMLYIDLLEKFGDNEVIVIDRWGTEVFRQKNYQNDWDFKKGGEYLPAGNYVCILKSGDKTFSRVVTVIK
ncbi:T9SS type B sorting domain-containing protein [Pseudochryseolinea flava]|uniref:PKD domain-containing protein n=1 Tax=Pseudochryseolinea flava TaxID=2059302 RepID=A0A364Y0R5_9BACT|nr:gliding motility-associated C-terminal domain-containing protein [Pseudochryseolinea flava]RAW00265.1 hypothetical protein DQQ10_14490 [Pseudochryseolinea flava]